MYCPPRIQRTAYKVLATTYLFVSLNTVPTPAHATIATAPFNVTATVLSVCIVVATDLAFGNYTGSNGTPTDATSSLVVTCSLGTTYTVGLNAGTTSGSTVAARSMASSGNKLDYLLYTNSGRTTLWGDGTLSTSTTGGTAGALPATYTVYGRIPAGQYVPSGIYSDIVTATVTY